MRHAQVKFQHVAYIFLSGEGYKLFVLQTKKIKSDGSCTNLAYFYVNNSRVTWEEYHKFLNCLTKGSTCSGCVGLDVMIPKIFISGKNIEHWANNEVVGGLYET